MVSIQPNQRKENTMLRLCLLALAAVLLSACALRMPVAPPPLPTPTPTPDPAIVFRDAYNAATFAYNAISLEMRGKDMMTAFDDPAFRKRLVELARDWRTKANALRYMEQPAGEKWNKAWPRITDAMAEFALIASAIEQAAEENNPFLLIGSGPRVNAAMALLDEATGILGRK